LIKILIFTKIYTCKPLLFGLYIHKKNYSKGL
jgi:hypothetical protein